MSSEEGQWKNTWSEMSNDVKCFSTGGTNMIILEVALKEGPAVSNAYSTLHVRRIDSRPCEI